MYQSTSRQAYCEKLGRDTMCLIMIGLYRKHGDMTDREFKKVSGWEINQVTARRNDLVNKKDCFGRAIPDVEIKGKKKNEGNRNVLIWGIITNEQREMF